MLEVYRQAERRSDGVVVWDEPYEGGMCVLATHCLASQRARQGTRA